MYLAYTKEKQQCVDKYLRLKPWYEGDLQRTVRTTKPDSLPDPITERSSWSGTVFWESCFKAELNKIEQQYSTLLAPKDAIRFMWVGIDPDITIYPNMLSLFNRLKELSSRFNFQAVVEAHTENGYRPHIHMILFTKDRPNRIVSTFSKFFKCKPNFIEAKNMKQFYQEKLEYIKGNKTASKLKYVEADKKERKDLGILDLIDST